MKKEEKERKKWIAGHQKQKETNTSSRVHHHPSTRHKSWRPLRKENGIENEANERPPKGRITQPRHSTAQLILIFFFFYLFIFFLQVIIILWWWWWWWRQVNISSLFFFILFTIYLVGDMLLAGVPEFKSMSRARTTLVVTLAVFLLLLAGPLWSRIFTNDGTLLLKLG